MARPPLESTYALWKKGYVFIDSTCRALGVKAFRTRLMMRPAICMQGEAAARLFYDNEKFMRAGAMPARAKKTLVGEGGVQGMDGHAHRHRKQMFTRELMSPERIEHLVCLHRGHWKEAIQAWKPGSEIVLFREAQKLLCKSVCAWAGVPLTGHELDRRAREFGHMIDSGAKLGPHHWRGRWARKSCERWLGQLIEDIRHYGEQGQAGSILQSIAWHRDEHGQRLPLQVAAVELINILRPTVAIAQLAVFCALALHSFPACRQKLQQGDEDYLGWFVLEVRRFYPFFPFLAAVVREDFRWQNLEFKRGQRVLLDIYGTHRDPALWQDPAQFIPERFKDWDGNSFGLIANGGATYEYHHRCPGEWITIALMKAITRMLVHEIEYTVPAQDLRLDLSRIPALPESGFIIQPVITPRYLEKKHANS
ncbi:cytochrome P450 [Methylobacillus flagellatus]|uniref:Fatty acid beta hydroxylase (Cytochrome P450) n=1 Tax=Methylobacillus flagellatus (strain ATCC 51484 / DSM 6875 / VKM B-1610 / KT) TaxID=265072 RepID=Q1H1C7_METFK|nr:cytochrome P450 [Methylobacillus flagellatus]ABE49710.1 fatty acid beta hydroxylase (cytochrome P450) [Methylobacillus flagellatus KT]